VGGWTSEFSGPLPSNLRSRIRHLTEKLGNKLDRFMSSAKIKRGAGSKRRFVVAGLLLVLGAFVGAGRCAGQDRCEVFFGSRPGISFLKTPQMAAEAEQKLQRDASDVETLRQLLDYYLCHWEQPEFQAPRTRLILWTIQNHPDLYFVGAHDDRGLLINPDDKEDYAQARKLWLEQVKQYPYFPDVLVNAAHCLKLTDRAEATGWLKRTDRYGLLILSEVYADAITGVTGENPLGGTTSLDVTERDSAFAKYAFEDAGKDKELAARTGWNLHLISNEFRYEKLDSADFDPLAEQLLLKSAELNYPQPVDVSYLDQFYRNQTLKPADKRVLCKAEKVHVAPEEQAERLVSSARMRIDPALLTEPVKVTVNIVVGLDGHVWEAVARNGSPKAAKAAVSAVAHIVYKPLKVDGQTVRVTSSVVVTLEPSGIIDRQKPVLAPD
jgi:hypothetical protein